MKEEILNKIRKDAGFGWGVAVRLYDHDANEMWVEYDRDGEECWPSREIMAKFAELIVRECSRVAKLKSNSNAVAAAIEEHFGVEE